MIKVKVRRGPHSSIRTLTVTGHAGHSEYGQDVVCAAVSALIQMIPVAVEQLTLEPIYCIKQPGRFRLRVPASRAEESKNLLFLTESVLCALYEIEKSYGEFIEIIEKGRENHV